eukprot:7523516-Alexandrium_andersonii.AAC.1
MQPGHRVCNSAARKPLHMQCPAVKAAMGTAAQMSSEATASPSISDGVIVVVPMDAAGHGPPN